MKASGLNAHNIRDAVAAAEQFLERCPDYDGSVLSANVLFERYVNESRPFTADAFEYTLKELQAEHLLESNDSRAVDALLAPVEDVRDYEPPQERETAPDDAKYDDYEIELAPGVEPADLTVDGLVNSLSPNTLKEMIQRAEEGDTPRQKSVWDDLTA